MKVILKGERVDDNIDYDYIAGLVRVTEVLICLNSTRKLLILLSRICRMRRRGKCSVSKLIRHCFCLFAYFFNLLHKIEFLNILFIDGGGISLVEKAVYRNI